MEKTYKMDMVVGKVIVELKSVNDLLANAGHMTNPVIGVLLLTGICDLYRENMMNVFETING